MIDPGQVSARFVELFTSEPRIFQAPGRVNLIGEHTDYNDGFVFPMAINHTTVVAARARSDRKVRVYSANLNEQLEFDLDRAGSRQRGIWLDYVEGMAQMLMAKGVRLGGADVALQSDVPVGSGLSSSAALEVSFGLALWTLSGNPIDLKTLALAGQATEHNYVGTKSGIMDQFISAMGKAEHALLIDCRSLESNLVPLLATDTSIVICDSQVKHALATSAYNTRRQECEEAVRILLGKLPDIAALRDVSPDEFKEFEDLLPDPIRRRARHVVTEDSRTLSAAEALRNSDFEIMGRLMFESHFSLRDDYEVSCPELDALVDIASKCEGVYGARMTGGGFGGCTVNLVRNDSIESLRTAVSEGYPQRCGKDALIYVTTAVDGAKEIT